MEGAVAPTYAAKGAAGACAFYALVFTLLTPLCSANSLAVPSTETTTKNIVEVVVNQTAIGFSDCGKSPKREDPKNDSNTRKAYNDRSQKVLKWFEVKVNYLKSEQKSPSPPSLPWYKIERHQSQNDENISKSIGSGEGPGPGQVKFRNRSNGSLSGNESNRNVNSPQKRHASSTTPIPTSTTQGLSLESLSHVAELNLWRSEYSPIAESAQVGSRRGTDHKIVLNKLNLSAKLKVKRSEISALDVGLEGGSRNYKNHQRFSSNSVSEINANSRNKLNLTSSMANATSVHSNISTSTSTSVSPKSLDKQKIAEDEPFFKKYGYIVLAVAISLTGAVTITLVVVLRCLRATRRATGALALPIPLLPEDRTPLNAEPEHPVPMLSVQSAGCAGMERLGVPARTSLSSPPDDRGHISRRMRVDAIQARDILVRDATILSDRQVRSSHYHRGGCGNNRGIDSCVGGHTEVIRCPHHVPLPDSEWGQDRDLQIRTRYQQAEITRSYIKPPPNKTVLDVPEQSYNLFSSSSFSSSLASAATSCNLGPNYSSQHSNQHHPQQHQPQQQQHHHPQQQKSKPNVITKFFSRKSSPKSPSSGSSSSSSSASSSSSSSSTTASNSSSSSSSLCSSPALPISTASALTTTNCNLGTSIGPSLSTLSGISTTTALTGCTTSLVGVTVPTNHNTTTAAAASSNNHHFHQNPLVGSTNHSLTPAATAPPTGPASSCNISTASLASASSASSTSSSSSSSSTSSSMGSLSSPSPDCCYTQATSVRPRTPAASSATTPTDGASNNNQQHPLPRDHV